MRKLIGRGDYMNVDRIINIRINANLKQKELAQKLNVSKSTYSRWETGEKIIPLKHLINFCNYFHITLDYALGLTNKKQEVLEPRELNCKSMGKQLKTLRKKENLSQEKLAQVLNTTQSTISSYENGKNTLLTAFLYDICTRYKVSADWMLQTK